MYISFFFKSISYSLVRARIVIRTLFPPYLAVRNGKGSFQSKSLLPPTPFMYSPVIIILSKTLNTDLKEYTPVFKTDSGFVIDISHGSCGGDGEKESALTDEIHYLPVRLTMAVFPLTFKLRLKGSSYKPTTTVITATLYTVVFVVCVI